MNSCRTLTCIVCPLGCALKVDICDGGINRIEGNRCKRGYEYAVSEVTDPKRVLTTTVKVKNGQRALVPVKTDVPVPKGLLMDCMKIINGIEAAAPISCSEILVKNILGTGANIIVTKGVEKHGEKVYHCAGSGNNKLKGCSF